MLENPSSSHPDLDPNWRRLEALVEEIADAARRDQSLAEFYGLLLQRAVAELPVAGGAVWRRDTRQQLQRIDMIGSPGIDTLTRREEHAARVHAAFGRLRQSVGGSSLDSNKSPPAGFDDTFCLAPVIVGDEVVAVLELVHNTDAPAAGRDNTRHVLAALADVAIDFHLAAQLRDLRCQAVAWDAAQEYSERVHSSLDLDETCYAIASEGRRLAEVDRLSLLVVRGKRARVRAISGVDRVDARAPDVVLLSRLATAILRVGEALWSDDAGEHPPQIQEQLDLHLDQSGARSVALLPLHAPTSSADSRVLGVLVAEQFKAEQFDPQVRQRLAICRRQAQTALANAVDLHDLPLLGLSRGLRGLAWLFGFRSLAFFGLFVWAALLLVAAGAAALCVVPADLAITARGRLQPASQQDIFAPVDGVIQEVLVRHGDLVARGDLLARLRNTELDYEGERVLGEIATNRANLQALQAARVAARRDRTQTVQFDAEIERLKQLLSGLERQQEILRRQRQELDIRAPVDGRVLAWEADQSLPARPVRQGQRLMTVADVDGDWCLHIDVPDEQIGHVLAARDRKPDAPLPVSYMLLSEPAQSHSGRLAEVALGTVITDDRDAVVPVEVAIDVAELAAPRPGAQVVARIDCGQRAIGYVWFRDIYEQVRKRFLF